MAALPASARVDDAQNDDLWFERSYKPRQRATVPHRGVVIAITVGELADVPHLGLEVLAGTAGLGREISWTHTSDLPEPWRWVTGGELLMTNGLSFPAHADAQARLVERLNDAGVSGLAIGEKMYCPALTDELTATCDRLGLPLLNIRYPLPFVAISRAVAEATLLDQSSRLTRTVRIYDLVRRHIARATTSADLFGALERELGCELHVCDRHSGEPWFPDTAGLDPATKAAVAELSESLTNVAAGAFGLPAVAGKTALLTDIQRHPSAALVAVTPEGKRVDPIQLQHAATVVSLELSQTQLVLEHGRRQGSVFLDRLLESRVDGPAAAAQLADVGLDPAAAVVIVAHSAEDDPVSHVHNALWRHSIPYLCTTREGILYAVALDGTPFDDVLARALGPTARIGVSQRLDSINRFQESIREASWAFSLAKRRGVPVSRYGSAQSWLGLSSVGDAQALVDRVLRPLQEYDGRQNASLVETLDAFLRNRRSWQRTAQALHVHRQTVIYRMRRVEEITKRDLAETDSVAELWLALRAAELLDAERDMRSRDTSPSRRLPGV
ncbi:Transcriptional activator PmfR [Mycolicibacterium mageritense]|uniref:Transcriptional activator PmfR n=1 Tax=Mycolicibacterium mageritense TaxID=53462 RepID=A0AAI8U0X9_MYCME|nr:Transcriptional activator PmfR [Mycolicibacterium mageritense]